MTTLIIILVALGALVGGLLLAARRRPQWFAPVMKILMRNEALRSRVNEKMVEEIQADPEQFQLIVEQEFGRAQSRQISEVMANKNPEELQELFDKAQSGQQLTVDDLRGKPRVPGKKVNKRRAANKRARQSRKKQRR